MALCDIIAHNHDNNPSYRYLAVLFCLYGVSDSMGISAPAPLPDEHMCTCVSDGMGALDVKQGDRMQRISVGRGRPGGGYRAQEEALAPPTACTVTRAQE